MIGYTFFILPMAIVFVRSSYRNNLQQALLDLIAFNLSFAFDFAAVMPGSFNLQLIQVLLLLLLGLRLLQLINGKKFSFSSQYLFLVTPSVLLVGWMVIVPFINHTILWDGGSLLNRGLVIHAIPFLGFFAGAQLNHIERLKRFGKIFLLGAAVASLVSVVQLASGGNWLTNDYADNYLGIFQPLGAKFIERRDALNAIGYVLMAKTVYFGGLSFYRAFGTYESAYVIISIAATILLRLSISNTTSKYSLTLGLILTIAGFVASLIRMALLGFVLISAIMVLNHPRHFFSTRKLAWILPSLLIGILVITVVPQIRTIIAANLDGIFGERGQQQLASLSGRRQVWEYVIPEIMQHPLLGSGAPITTFVVEGHGDSIIDIGAHNTIFNYAYRGGILPAILFIFICTYVLIRLYLLAHSSQLDNYGRTVFSAIFYGYLTFIFLNQSLAHIEATQVGVLFWILCGSMATFSPHGNFIKTQYRRQEAIPSTSVVVGNFA